MSEDQGSNTGYSFLATIIASGIIGFFIDKFFETQPWGLMGFLVIGIVYATYKAQISMQVSEQKPTQSSQQNDDNQKDDKKV